MSEKKKPPKGDLHRSGFLIRLPEAFREAFRELKEKTGQPFTWATQRAVVAYLKANGIKPPDPSHNPS